MIIRQLEISNFRGVKSLIWKIPVEKRFICLVGPGDGRKSTILDAINLALTSRWNIPFTDADFFNLDVSSPIVIRVAVTDLSPEILDFKVMGGNLSGIQDDGTMLDEPVAECDPCIIVQLKVESDFEPRWSVVRPHDTEFSAHISGSIRSKFGIFKIDDRIDSHLRWGRGSALSRMTEELATSSTMHVAQRAARDAAFTGVTVELQTVTDGLRDQAHALGSATFDNLRPGLDGSMLSSSGGLALFDGELPITNFGLGSRRLTGLAAQKMAAEGSGIFLIDELEYGLEPHRVVHLLRCLKKESPRGQVILTSHSPVSVEQLDAADLAVVCLGDHPGDVKIAFVPSELESAQAALRFDPSSFLARRVVIGEGKTELGFLRGILKSWDQIQTTLGDPPSASLGVAYRDGKGGSQAPKHAELFSNLGYATALIVDNDDRAIDPSVEAASTSGVTVIRWTTGHSFEDELILSCDITFLQSIVDLAVELRGSEEAVRSDLSIATGCDTASIDLSIEKWIESTGRSLEQIRQGVSFASQQFDANRVSTRGNKDRSWFKDEYRGEALAKLTTDHWDRLKSTDFASGLIKLHSFVYATHGENARRQLFSDTV